MASWSDLAVSAIAGLGAGVVGSLVAPWVNWGVEQRREQRKARADLLRAVEIDIEEPTFTLSEFVGSQIYQTIVPYLKISVREELERVVYSHNFVIDDSGRQVLVTEGVVLDLLLPKGGYQRDKRMYFSEEQRAVLELRKEVVRLKSLWSLI